MARCLACATRAQAAAPRRLRVYVAVLGLLASACGRADSPGAMGHGAGRDGRAAPSTGGAERIAAVGGEGGSEADAGRSGNMAAGRSGVVAADGGEPDSPAEGGAEGASDAPVVPRGLDVSALEGGNGVLDLVALTLRNGPGGTELYAALRNTGDRPACHAALSVELFDQNEQSLAASIGGLLTQHFYRITDGSGTIAACVGPGDVTMAAITDWPADVAIEDVGYVVYRCPYFALEVAAIDGLRIAALEPVASGNGTAYRGTLHNDLDVAVSNPSITVFPTTRVGRPLDVVSVERTLELAPGDHWEFQTPSIDVSSADAVAFPAGAIAR